MRNLFVLAALFLLLQSCNQTQVVKIKNHYSMELPKSMEAIKNLHPLATLQYKEKLGELYVIVIDEKKKEMHDALEMNGLTEIYSNDVEGYATLLVDDIKTRIKVKSSTPLKKEKINGHDARTLEINAVVDGMDIFYTIAYIEGAKTYYQILTWSNMSEKSKYSDKMKKMIHSFKEI